MPSVRFKVGQKFASKNDTELSAVVVQLVDGGRGALMDLHKKGDLWRSQPIKYVEFIDYWTLLTDEGILVGLDISA